MVGIIGFGNMGSAIGLVLQTKYQITAFDKDSTKLQAIQPLAARSSSLDVAKESDIIILAVKPQDMDVVLFDLRNTLKDKIVISIAAGITTGHIESILDRQRVIRAMPNIGIKIAMSVTAFCRGRYGIAAKELFDCCGVTREIEEKMMDAVTAISGSGPAYLYYDIEKNNIDPFSIEDKRVEYYVDNLYQAAKALGFQEQEARFLSEHTVDVSLRLLKQTRLPPAVLRQLVTSKGGTTEAAIKVLDNNGSWVEAAWAAKRRAEELAKKE